MAFVLVMLFLTSCASYNQQASGFYNSLAEGDYAKASDRLDHNKLLKKNRNRLLYLLEKGRVEHLLHHYEKSNRYLNEADLLMEDARTSAKDIIAGTLLNPMMESYKGEDFEKYMVHYYKALNYLQLHQTEEAIVEARRINLRTNAQDDHIKGDRYTEDAFSLMLQGMIYEKAGDVNNAFIAYRNAANLYLKNNQLFYGTPMPLQLKKDLLRMAYVNGFVDELERYENLFDLEFDRSELDHPGELVLFWENGLAPVKKENNLVFSLTKNGSDFFFIDHAGLYRVPFDFSTGYSKEKLSLAGAHSFRVAIPSYESQPVKHQSARIYLDNKSFSFEPAQNINELAIETLQEKRIRDLSKALTRLAIKKLAEEAARPDEDEKDKNKKRNMEMLAFGFKIFSIASEKADTRNWQSLPHSIHYIRLPLKKGENTISIELGGPASTNRELSISNQGGLQFLNISTF